MASIYRDSRYGCDIDGNRGVELITLDDISEDEVEVYLIENYGDDREEWPLKITDFPVHDGEETYYFDLVVKDYI
jgi:hypothetical protein